MIVISDIHLKEKEPFLTCQKKFLNWLLENYQDENIVFLGDIFDSSSPTWVVYYEFKSFLAKRNRGYSTYIIVGNHDKSSVKGNSLDGISTGLDNVYVITERQELIIEGKQCLLCPHEFNAKELYKDFEYGCDYAFFHLTNEEDAFGNEGINTDKIDVGFAQIFGHTHTKHIINNKKLVCGVPLPTRNLEVNNPIIKITDEGYSFVDHPIWFEFETLKYGEFPSNKMNVLNIVDAPSITSIREMYKNYYVREEGVTFSDGEVHTEGEVFEFKTDNLESLWADFCSKKENNVENGIRDTALKYFEKVGA